VLKLLSETYIFSVAFVITAVEGKGVLFNFENRVWQTRWYP